MLKCKAITELVSLQCEQKLKFRQQLAINLHLMVCKRCRGFAKNTQVLDETLKTFCRAGDSFELKE